MNTLVALASPAVESRYQIRSITPAVPPEGGEGTWYQYIIVQGCCEITGLRCGNHDEVNLAVQDMVERLNERSAGKNSKKLKPEGVKSPPAVVSSA